MFKFNEKIKIMIIFLSIYAAESKSQLNLFTDGVYLNNCLNLINKIYLHFVLHYCHLHQYIIVVGFSFLYFPLYFLSVWSFYRAQ
jgi:hypothetical protein